ncbi:MAG TPA: methylated-DNA--[protein]-cysteine S-methyltransferase [Acidimicrobiales bacterium]|nr:methylated-DNA--[protein]-cysteine S-methyltransferase [Acidimicrobiales bacterium]
MNPTDPFLTTSPSPDGDHTHRYWDEITLSIGDRKTEVLLVSDGEALVHVWFGPLHPGADRPAEWMHDPKPLQPAASQLESYAAGDLEQFDLAIRPKGTAFQLRVWRELMSIPYGTTTTYGRIADGIGSPTGSRAVGAAVGANPIGIVVPCHRVIGANGSLTGYAGGLENKVALLKLEGVAAV